MIETKYANDEHFKILKLNEKRLDASNSKDFKSEVLHTIETFPETVILDMSEVQFLDSSGLGALIAILKTRTKQNEFILCGLSQNVERVFELTMMNRTFNVKVSPEDAMNSVSK